MQNSSAILPVIKNTKIKSRGERGFQIAAIILLVILSFFILMPIINVLATALSTHTTKPYFWPVGWDIFAIKTVLTEPKFYSAFMVSLGVTLLGTLISVLCMTMAAYPLSKKDLPFRKGIMIFFFIAMLFSGGMVPNYILMSTLKLTNTLFAMIFPSVVQVYHLILIKNFFEGLPEALEESARIDGASNVKVLFKIIMPVSVSMIITISLFTAVVYWNNYFNALMYINPNASNLYPLPFYVMNLRAEYEGPNAALILGDKFKYADNIKAATIILGMLPIVVTYPFFLKFFTKGVTVGSVKG